MDLHRENADLLQVFNALNRYYRWRSHGSRGHIFRKAVADDAVAVVLAREEYVASPPACSPAGWRRGGRTSSARFGACSQRRELVAQTDAEQRDARIQHIADIGDDLGCSAGSPGPLESIRPSGARALSSARVEKQAAPLHGSRAYTGSAQCSFCSQGRAGQCAAVLRPPPHRQWQNTAARCRSRHPTAPVTA